MHTNKYPQYILLYKNMIKYSYFKQNGIVTAFSNDITGSYKNDSVKTDKPMLEKFINLWSIHLFKE